jgi:hypothetical protein
MICPKCGNTGFTKDGLVCSCKRLTVQTADQKPLLFVPKAFKGVTLDSTLIKPVTLNYPKELTRFHDSILNAGALTRNFYLYAPHGSSKTIFTFSILQQLHAVDIPIYPYLDIDELKIIIRNLDMGSTDIPGFDKYEINPYSLYDVPVLITKVPVRPSYLTFETLATLIDRRGRRGKGTIIISDYPWEYFTARDKVGHVKWMKGDGTYTSISVREYCRKEV